MKRLTFLFCLYLIGLMASAANPVRIACVGNSITFGAGIANRDKNSYPAQLQAMLGAAYDVRNFGVSGRTALHRGDLPYVRTGEFAASKEFAPDIVIIKLGTNDTKPQNWKYRNDFTNDYQALIDAYRALPSSPRIILLTPLRCFLTDESGISPTRIAQDVRPMVEDLAWRNDVEIVNMFNLFGDTWNPALMPDRLHPSAIGAGMMARKIAGYLTRPTAPADKKAGLAHLTQTTTGTTAFNFHGFKGYEFRLDDLSCRLVVPKTEAPGRPWVLRARFFGHEPQADIDLLEQGFYIAYCDVADLYGAPSAVKRWDRFYKYMKKAGFAPKVVLEGMSRGGLIVYNWAAKHPGRVACIYADAPVMDFKSWPMGQGASAGDEGDTKRLLAAYGFGSEEEALTWKKGPLYAAKTLAKAGIPILHIVGDADDVVPVDENTALFEAEMKRLGAPITVIHKPGIGHHPHSLNDPGAIVRFILRATGRYANPCLGPVPGNEFRADAG